MLRTRLKRRINLLNLTLLSRLLTRTNLSILTRPLIYLLEKALFETKRDLKHSWVSIETNDVTRAVTQGGTTPTTLDVLFDRTPNDRFDIIIEIVRNLAPDKVALQFHIRIHSPKTSASIWRRTILRRRAMLAPAAGSVPHKYTLKTQLGKRTRGRIRRQSN